MSYRASVQAHSTNLDDVAALTDPNADRIPFWDDSAGHVVWLAPSTGLTISGTNITASGSSGLGLTPTAVKTANYTAAAGDLVPVDTTSGAVTVTLPSAPADQSMIAVTFVTQGSTNNVTIARGGSDVFNKTGGSTSITLVSVPSARLFQYQATGAIWHVVASRTVSPVPVADGGTGATDTSTARTNLSLVIGTDVEAHDADLTTIGGLSPANDDVIQRKSGAWANRTIAQLKTDLSLPGPTVGTDTLWDAAGDVALGTGADTAARLAVSTSAGAALAADPNATNKVSWQYPLSVDSASRGATGSLASTYDRSIVAEGNVSALSSGRLNLVRILLPKGMTVTNITFWSATTALSSGSNQWFALFSSARGKLAVTSDDTSTAWAANSAKTLALSSAYVTTTAGWYYLGIMVKVTGAVPTLAGVGSLGTSNIRTAALLPHGTSDTGLTDPASCPSTATALTLAGTMIYAEVS